MTTSARYAVTSKNFYLFGAKASRHRAAMKHDKEWNVVIAGSLLSDHPVIT